MAEISNLAEIQKKIEVDAIQLSKKTVKKLQLVNDTNFFKVLSNSENISSKSVKKYLRIL